MNLCFNKILAKDYQSPSQAIRVMSEDWVTNNLPCPCCGASKLLHLKNNMPVADFKCTTCGEIFELKSKGHKLGKKISDGAYDTAIKRITSNTNPHLLVLEYHDFNVVNMELIPKYFFTPEIIEKRKPLSANARRAGWTGCNIVYGNIPIQGRITIIKDGIVKDIEKIVLTYSNTKNFEIENITKRGWLFDILFYINSIKKEVFTLSDVYAFEDKLSKKHPDNHNIKSKIRQQLQFLRDKGYIEFLGNGMYKKIV